MSKNTARLLIALSLTLCACDNNSNNDEGDASVDENVDASQGLSLRVATYNTALSRAPEGALALALETSDDSSAKHIASVIQRVRPDVILLNEVDRDDQGKIAKNFVTNYLATAQDQSLEPIDYPYIYVPATNTGVSSGQDLDGDGKVAQSPGSRDWGNDSFGFGEFPGHYGMVLLSTYPIDTPKIRSFQNILWKDVSDSLIPKDFYSAEAVEVMRMSSKNHVDVPILVQGKTLHALISHPTPPSFDGPEDRNGKRNHDEIKFWSDYLTTGIQTAYIKDDAGAFGALDDPAYFIILGDLNSDPKDGGSRNVAIEQLLNHPRTVDSRPSSQGGEQAAQDDGGANTQHNGAPQFDTANFNDSTVGNLRVDYVIPSATLNVKEQGIFWPLPSTPEAVWSNASDHRLVWIDVMFK